MNQCEHLFARCHILLHLQRERQEHKWHKQGHSRGLIDSDPALEPMYSSHQVAINSVI